MRNLRSTIEGGRSRDRRGRGGRRSVATAVDAPLPTHEALERALQDAAGKDQSLAVLEVQATGALALVHGHLAVEHLLDHIGAHLRSIDGTTVFRLLEGRFGLLFTAAPDEVERVCQDLVHLPRGADACIGVARLRDGEPAALLSDRADHALAHARRQGPGSMVMLTHGGEPGDHVNVSHARALLTMLREARIRVHYQPIMAIDGRRLLAFEALARPQLDHDLPGPEVAFRVARRMGLSVELDALCRRSIFDDQPGLSMPPAARLHVNLAGEALGHRSLSARELHRQVQDADIEPERVVFEVSADLGTSIVALRSELDALRSRGYGLCLDNLGAEAPGLPLLGLGCFTMVKLSPELIGDLGEQVHAEALLDSISAYAARTGIRVLAAGVETSDQLAFLRRYRFRGQRPIAGIQGFHLGGPSRHPELSHLDVDDDGRGSAAVLAGQH